MHQVQMTLKKQQGFKCPHCTKPERWCKTPGGLMQHINSVHIELFHSMTIKRPQPPSTSPSSSQVCPQAAEAPDDLLAPFDNLNIKNDQLVGSSDLLNDTDAPGLVETHLVLTGMSCSHSRLLVNFMPISPLLAAAPCDALGNLLPNDTSPPPHTNAKSGDWTPYWSRLKFELSEFLFKCEQMSQTNILFLLKLWAADVIRYGGDPPFEDHAEMFCIIDSIGHGDAPWQCLKVRYTGSCPEGVVPTWMDKVYEIWFHDPCIVAWNMLKNPNFNGVFNSTLYCQFMKGGECHFGNLMSRNWAWRQVVHYLFRKAAYIYCLGP